MAEELNISMENFNELVECHLPYIVRTISDVTGRYVSLEHDEEFVIALSPLQRQFADMTAVGAAF